MSSGDVARLSERLVTLKKSIPDCFARKPRGLQEIERWKATEFRQLLLLLITFTLFVVVVFS